MKTTDKIPPPKPLAEKHPILRARPVKGEVDHTALSREHMARYPKIRAALANREANCKHDDEGK
jgi:hypothetical protein